FERDSDERNEVRISTRATEDEVLVEIADTGRGIPAEHLERLFDPFFTTKSVGEGSGLGLSICYNIIESYAGRIEVESSPGEGSRFVVRLPIAIGPGAAARVVDAPPSPAPPERARILIIDDEPLVLSTAKLILGREHEVLGARSGREALEVLHREPEVDVILCDLMMREISGMELYASLRRNAPALADRMVFMTGGAFTRTAQEFLGDVKNPCIEKPFKASDLMQIVRQAIRVP
ncbi:MAG: hybrid sensor histidine kinase/response regulator, partial [Candidatus Binatia bacterium]